MTEFDVDFLAAARVARREFLVAVEEHRPALYHYCRRLTGSVWDAEDLVQDTLVKAFATAAQTHYPIGKPLPWLVRVATNVWIDQRRRAREVVAEVVDWADTVPSDPMEVRDALTELLHVLSPQERAAVVLKDVFDYPLAEIAAMLGTTTGAVKAALSRGRGRLSDEDRAARKERLDPPAREVVERVADAFTSYDIDRMTNLFLEDAVCDVVGMVSEEGVEAIRQGSILHTFSPDMTSRFRAEVHEYDGEPVIVLHGWDVDSGGRPVTPEEPTDVVRFETLNGMVRRMRWYYFCPETLTEVGRALGLTMDTHGYRDA